MKTIQYKYHYTVLLFRTINKTWAVLFAISLLFCIQYEILLTNITAPFRWFVGFGIFSSQVAYGYIAGYSFYFLTVHMPNVQKRVKLFRYIQNELAFLNSSINDMFVAISKGKYPNENRELSVQEIDNYLRNINPLEPFHEFGQIVLDAPQFSHQNFYIYFRTKSEIILNLVDKIILFQDILDTDTLKYLTYISDAFKRQRFLRGIFLGNADSSPIFKLTFMHLPFYLKKLNEASNKNWRLTHIINLAMNKEESDRQRESKF